MTPTQLTAGLWWSASSATLAALFVWMGAVRGIPAHRHPRVLVAAATTVIACTYWGDLLGADTQLMAEWRRGAGWMLWPGLAWTAWTGVAYSRRVVAATARLLDGAADDDAAG